jgi:uncharacterized integral membrane protein
MLISLIFGLLLGVVTVIFALQNVTEITVSFLAWDIKGSLALILLLAATSGVVVSMLVALPQTLKKHWKLVGLRKQNKNLEAELSKRPAEVVVVKSTDTQPEAADSATPETPKTS